MDVTAIFAPDSALLIHTASVYFSFNGWMIPVPSFHPQPANILSSNTTIVLPLYGLVSVSSISTGCSVRYVFTYSCIASFVAIFSTSRIRFNNCVMISGFRSTTSSVASRPSSTVPSARVVFHSGIVPSPFLAHTMNLICPLYATTSGPISHENVI